MRTKWINVVTVVFFITLIGCSFLLSCSILLWHVSQKPKIRWLLFSISCIFLHNELHYREQIYFFLYTFTFYLLVWYCSGELSVFMLLFSLCFQEIYKFLCMYIHHRLCCLFTDWSALRGCSEWNAWSLTTWLLTGWREVASTKIYCRKCFQCYRSNFP